MGRLLYVGCDVLVWDIAYGDFLSSMCGLVLVVQCDFSLT